MLHLKKNIALQAEEEEEPAISIPLGRIVGIERAKS